jgi:putative FmdB family regulatory protein
LRGIIHPHLNPLPSRERKIKEGYICMPIFEFRCEKCKKTFETLVFGSQAVSCPKCKSKKVKKLMSAFSHSSEGKFTSSAGSGCGTCSATRDRKSVV